MITNAVFEFQQPNKKTKEEVLSKALFKTITKHGTLKMVLLESTQNISIVCSCVQSQTHSQRVIALIIWTDHSQVVKRLQSTRI